ncbi:O-acetyl-ADP-ribose deacetylase [Kitasatospora sp. NPDC049258]|uniref:O-acetyl-ADP-ribose deacetylase n=1 Tax=Kitasatospora sp. NPDC049258 TaxID=3155394 RepID=UPI0034344942
MTQITLVQGDITEQQVDVVVNAANSSLLGGGGVDGAIHRKGGPAILADCRRLRDSHYGGGLDVGRAVVTTAGRLPADWVVHTVGPVHHPADYERRAELLASCYRESLRLAAELGARAVAFPAISTGVYRWPMEDAARIALTAVAETVAAEDPAAAWPAEVRFVLFGTEAYEVFERMRRELERPGTERPAAE